MTKLSNYIRQALAFVTGDKNEKQALQNENQSKAYLKLKISAIEAKVGEDEMELDKLVESYNKTLASVEGENIIPVTKDWPDRVYKSHEKVEDMRAQLKESNEMLEFFKGLYGGDIFKEFVAVKEDKGQDKA